MLIKASNISIEFPIYNSRSLKNTVIKSITGGLIRIDPKNTVVKAIDNLSFNITSGERVGLWGPNGSGKTTLLRALAGIYKPTKGTLEVKGSIASLLNVSFGMYPEATGMDNIYIRAAMMGITKKEMEKKIDDITEFTELGEFLALPVRTYSSGMRMRLAFAIVTSIKADIVLMDEWLSVGDVSFQEKSKTRLDKMLSNAKVLVIASHNRSMLENTCTRILHLKRGVLDDDILIQKD